MKYFNLKKEWFEISIDFYDIARLIPQATIS